MKTKLWLCMALAGLLIGLTPAQTSHAAELPTKYRNENITPVKDQKDQGLCWVFSGVSAMEAELIQNNGISKSIDFSEIQLAYFTANPAMDSLGQMNLLGSGVFGFLNGAARGYLGQSLTNGLSPVAEKDVPIAYDDVAICDKIDASLAYTGQYYLKEYKSLEDLSQESIKNAIIEYGAVEIGFDGNALANYSEETYAWYNPDPGMNHVVCIVGWDDNFPKENFVITPEGDGAWIAKNSWGEQWGDNGFFYLSYYDKGNDEAAVFDMEPGTYSDQIYQNTFDSLRLGKTDENGVYRTINMVHEYEKVANVFTACANEKGGEMLKGVSFFTYVPVDYTIWIYKNVKESQNPESGTLAATLKGSLSGTKILELEKPLYLSEGESYAIVVSTVDRSGRYAGVSGSSTSGTWLPTLGQSYGLDEEGNWVDYAAVMGQNFSIKAYTDDTEKDTKEDKKKVLADIYSLQWDYMYRPEEVAEVNVGFVNSASATLNWEKEGNAFYTVYQYNAASETWTRIGETQLNNYTVNGLKPGTSYVFGVKKAEKYSPPWEFYQVYFESREFAEVTVKTTSVKDVVPTVTVGKAGNTVKWSKISGATRYEVYVLSPETDYVWKKVKSVKSGSSLKYNDTEVKLGLTYGYRVYAYKGNKKISSGIPVSVIYE